MTSGDFGEFMALMAIYQHRGRPHTPTDQAEIESFYGHIKGEWPHLEEITDPVVLDAELARVRDEYNQVRLHAGIGYVTPLKSEVLRNQEGVFGIAYLCRALKHLDGSGDRTIRSPWGSALVRDVNEVFQT